MTFHGNINARNSLVCLNVSFFICRFSSMRFHFDQNVAAPAVVPLRSSSIASHKISVSGAPTNIAFCLRLSIFSQFSAALGCRTNKEWVLSQGGRLMPRQRALVPDGPTKILSLRVSPFTAAFPVPPADLHTLLPFSPFLVRFTTRWDHALEAVTS